MDLYTGESGDQPKRSVITSHGTENTMVHLHDLEETPHGRYLGIYDVVMMIIQRIIGSGIFVVSSMVYRDVGGSPFLFFLVWLIAGYSSYAGTACFGELSSIVPRSGGMKVFLEYIYFKPRMMVSVLFNCFNIIFGNLIANTLVLGKYLLYSCGYEIIDSHVKIVGLLFLFLTCVILGVSTKVAIKIQSIAGLFKLILMAFISLTGVYVILLPKSVTGIENNLHPDDFFTFKREVTFASLTSAVLKAIFSLSGWQTTHVVMNEVKDPVRTMKIAAPLGLFLINACYFLINFSYLVVIPSDELLGIDEMVGSVFFEKLFGPIIGKTVLTASVPFSVAGNIIVVLYHASRLNQEIFRTGVLPFSRFFASNYPFGAPLAALLIPMVLTTTLLCIPTEANVFDYAVNLESYPLQIFVGLICFGILIIRRRSPELNPEMKASYFDIFFMTSFSFIMFIGPLSPFKESTEFPGLPNYAYLSLFILGLCFVYWLGMFIIFPKIRNYKLTETEVELSDGLKIKKWEKIPNYSLLLSSSSSSEVNQQV